MRSWTFAGTNHDPQADENYANKNPQGIASHIVREKSSYTLVIQTSVINIYNIWLSETQEFLSMLET